MNRPPNKARSSPQERVGQALRPLSDSQARWTFTLLAICVVGLVPRVYLGVNDAIEYDGWWHLFAAQQDVWRNFIAECRAVAHPPLYLLLLKASMAFGKTRLVYRAVSIAAGVASIFMIGRIARRISSRPALSLIAALTFALSWAAIDISCEVRSYSLAVFFVLVAFDALQRLSSVDCVHPVRHLATFSAAASLALFSHYFVAFFLGACAVVAALRPLVEPSLAARLRSLSPVQWLARSALLAPVPVSAAYLYFSHARSWVTALNHLPAYYFHAGSGETATAFLFRNFFAEVNLFSPLAVPGGAVARILVAAGLVLAFIAAPTVITLKGGTYAISQATPLLFVAFLVSALAAASVLDAYPFGGLLRHQFIVFPFLVLSGLVVLDRCLSLIRRRFLVVAALGVSIAAIPANSYHQVTKLTIRPHEIGWPQASLLRREFPRPGAVYADQYSLICLFAKFDRCSWRYVDGPTEGMRYERYELRCGGEPFFVLRDMETWNVDFASGRVYRDLHDYLSRTRLPSTIVFFIDQLRPAKLRSLAEQQAFQAEVENMAARAGLRADRIVLDGYNGIVRFVPSTAGQPAASVR